MKKILIIALLGAAVSGSLADPLLYWGSENAVIGSGQEVLYTNGLAVVAASDWLIELVNEADDSVLYSTTDGFLAGEGTFFDTPDATGWNGLNVRTVIFDAPTKEAAGMFAEFTLIGNLSWGIDPAPPGTFIYNAGGVTAELGSAPGQWQAIPEPAVAALLGIFGGGLLVARRLFPGQS